jgi:hypothetical protein
MDGQTTGSSSNASEMVHDNAPSRHTPLAPSIDLSLESEEAFLKDLQYDPDVQDTEGFIDALYHSWYVSARDKAMREGKEFHSDAENNL